MDPSAPTEPTLVKMSIGVLFAVRPKLDHHRNPSIGVLFAVRPRLGHHRNPSIGVLFAVRPILGHHLNPSIGVLFAVRPRLDHHWNPSLLTSKRAWFSVSLGVGLRRSKRQSDHSPPFSAVIKNEWNFNSIAQHILVAWWLCPSGSSHIILR